MPKSIYSPNVHKHKNPIPHASLLDGLLISSAITGIELDSGQFPKSKDDQIALAFKNMEYVLNEAKATVNDIVKVDLFFQDKADRKLVNPIWISLFPNDMKRPARHSHMVNLEGNCILQIVFTAIIKSQ